jgi:hypothetical protein
MSTAVLLCAAGQSPPWRPGFPSCAQAIGSDLNVIQWCHIFGIFMIAVISQQNYIRFLRAQTQDQRFSPFGARGGARGQNH